MCYVMSMSLRTLDAIDCPYTFSAATCSGCAHSHYREMVAWDDGQPLDPNANVTVLLQGPSSTTGQENGAGQAQPDPIKVPQEPMVRDITAGLSIPEDVDELMREHIKFLYREGKALRMPMLCWQPKCQTLHAGKQCEAGPYEAMHTPRCIARCMLLLG